MSVIPLPTARRPVALVVAVDAFLDRFRRRSATRATYTETLRRLRETAGDQLPVAALVPEIYEQTMARWGEGAANTWNKRLSALTSFSVYCHRQDWLTTDPGRRLERMQGHPNPGQGHPPVPGSTGCSPTTATRCTGTVFLDELFRSSVSGRRRSVTG
ncbi:hypothetical protein [Micromonospora sp. KC606]|uniref:hypothetical protein n=1 Tax=Micromonospora sp. KC606 TaxID=2530379 RepID=UPI001FB6F4BD|nr:hypothetical protein [Micromonospora sp. KC606]